MQITIMGKRYHLKYVTRLPGDVLGLCDHPDNAHKLIRLTKGMRQDKELEITVHELLHAANWQLDHDWVIQTSRDVSRVLFRLGWRKNNGGK
jgi:hypothetical protein